MFIKLTDLDKKYLYLNANKIVEFYDSDEGKDKFTYVIYGVNGARDHLATVKESPEEIMQLIKEASK